MRQRDLTWLTLCLLTATLWALAASVGPFAWAGPPAQTVPTVTPIRPKASTPASSEEQPSPPVETPVAPASTLPSATAQPPLGTATPGTQAPMPTPSPLAPNATREPAPTAAWQTDQAAGAAPPALPALQQCAPAVTPAAAVSLPPVTDSSGPANLAWLVLLGVGTMLVGLGLVLISRKDA